MGPVFEEAGIDAEGVPGAAEGHGGEGYDGTGLERGEVEPEAEVGRDVYVALAANFGGLGPDVDVLGLDGGPVEAQEFVGPDAGEEGEGDVGDEGGCAAGIEQGAALGHGEDSGEGLVGLGAW